jgi:hypothetical protein
MPKQKCKSTYLDTFVLISKYINISLLFIIIVDHSFDPKQGTKQEAKQGTKKGKDGKILIYNAYPKSNKTC